MRIVAVLALVAVALSGCIGSPTGPASSSPTPATHLPSSSTLSPPVTTASPCLRSGLLTERPWMRPGDNLSVQGSVQNVCSFAVPLSDAGACGASASPRIEIQSANVTYVLGFGDFATEAVHHAFIPPCAPTPAPRQLRAGHSAVFFARWNGKLYDDECDAQHPACPSAPPGPAPIGVHAVHFVVEANATRAIANATIEVRASMPFRTLAWGAQSGIHDRLREVVNDQSAWDALWMKHRSNAVACLDTADCRAVPPPAVDFTVERVVAVTAGDKGNTCWTIEVTNASRAAATTAVEVTTIGPSGRAMCGEAITQPYHFIALPREGSNIAFTDRDVTPP